MDFPLFKLQPSVIKTVIQPQTFPSWVLNSTKRLKAKAFRHFAGCSDVPVCMTRHANQLHISGLKGRFYGITRLRVRE